MSGERYTFDTNVLFYAIDPDAPEKHAVARRIVGPNDGRSLLLLQSLGELCNAIRRKQPADAAKAYRWVGRGMTLFEVVSAIPADLNDAIEAQQEHGLQFWDAMLWATARRAGCRLLLSEDLQDGRTLGGVRFANPFLLPADELTKLLG